jgi:hypothetical protein
LELKTPPGWEKDRNFQAFFGGAPDRWLELNAWFHILLLGVRFPGYLETDVVKVVTAAMLERKTLAVSRLQSDKFPEGAAQVLEVVHCYDELAAHLEQQRKMCLLEPVPFPVLQDVKAVVLPSGARLEVELEDVSDGEDAGELEQTLVVSGGTPEAKSCDYRQTDQYLGKRTKKKCGTSEADPTGRPVKKKKREKNRARKWQLQPVSILKEYWSPKPVARKSSRKPYTQRLMDVLMVNVDMYQRGDHPHVESV